MRLIPCLVCSPLQPSASSVSRVPGDLSTASSPTRGAGGATTSTTTRSWTKPPSTAPSPSSAPTTGTRRTPSAGPTRPTGPRSTSTTTPRAPTTARTGSPSCSTSSRPRPSTWSPSWRAPFRAAFLSLSLSLPGAARARPRAEGDRAPREPAPRGAAASDDAGFCDAVRPVPVQQRHALLSHLLGRALARPPPSLAAGSRARAPRGGRSRLPGSLSRRPAHPLSAFC